VRAVTRRIVKEGRLDIFNTATGAEKQIAEKNLKKYLRVKPDLRKLIFSLMSFLIL
jgi:predicted nucleotidyltransferase